MLRQNKIRLAKHKGVTTKTINRMIRDREVIELVVRGRKVYVDTKEMLVFLVNSLCKI